MLRGLAAAIIDNADFDSESWHLAAKYLEFCRFLCQIVAYLHKNDAHLKNLNQVRKILNVKYNVYFMEKGHNTHKYACLYV